MLIVCLSPPLSAGNRLTFQHFNCQSKIVAMLTPHNSDARLSNRDEPWPMVMPPSKRGRISTFPPKMHKEYLIQRCRREWWKWRRWGWRRWGDWQDKNGFKKYTRKKKSGSREAKHSQDTSVVDMTLGLWMIQCNEGSASSPSSEGRPESGEDRNMS